MQQEMQRLQGRPLHLAPQSVGDISRFDAAIAEATGAPLSADVTLHTVQVNIGLRCNLICRHCHVNSSPRRTEAMDWPTMEAVVRLAQAFNAQTVDITGGAPEMHPEFRRFVETLRANGFEVIVRTNLTILLEPEYAGLPAWFARQNVRLIASLPCYLEENVDAQRGEGVYRESIEAIRRLNAVGYGIRSELPLDLIYNPGGATLPPAQAALEADYKKTLHERFGVSFTRLLTITNVPIGRFRGDLRRQHKLEPYLATLETAFNPATVDPLMCRHQISVRWDGALYDCDFNLALGLGLQPGARTVHDVNPDELRGRAIATGDHCFACTAGAGSSCGGALT